MKKKPIVWGIAQETEDASFHTSFNLATSLSDLGLRTVLIYFSSTLLQNHETLPANSCLPLSTYLEKTETPLKDYLVPTQHPLFSLITFTHLSDCITQTQKAKMIEEAKNLDVDCILFYLQGLSVEDTIDFFSTFTHKIVISSANPKSIKKTYLFLQSFVWHTIYRMFSHEPRALKVIQEFKKAKSISKKLTMASFLYFLHREDPHFAYFLKETLHTLSIHVVLSEMQEVNEIQTLYKLQETCYIRLGIKLLFPGTVFHKKLQVPMPETNTSHDSTIFSLNQLSIQRLSYRLLESAIEYESVVKEDHKKVKERLKKLLEIAKNDFSLHERMKNRHKICF